MIITGGVGFIGSHLTELLLKKDYTVYIIDNWDDYYDINIKKQNTEMLVSKGAKFIKDDILNMSRLQVDSDTIIHLAAKAGVRNSFLQTEEYIKTNIMGTKEVLEFSRKKDIENFVFSSSSSVYGNNKITPFKTTDSCNNIISPYAMTKLAGESLCNTYSEAYGINTKVLRFFTVYGPRQRPDMAFNKFIKLLLNNQPIPDYNNLNTFRDYTYVDDIVDGIYRSISYPKSEIFNLGNSKPIKLIEAINSIEELLSKKAIYTKMINIPKGDVIGTFSDISKAERLLGYKPKTSLDVGIKNMISWYKEGLK